MQLRRGLPRAALQRRQQELSARTTRRLSADAEPLCCRPARRDERNDRARFVDVDAAGGGQVTNRLLVARAQHLGAAAGDAHIESRGAATPGSGHRFVDLLRGTTNAIEGRDPRQLAGLIGEELLVGDRADVDVLRRLAQDRTKLKYQGR